MTTTKFMFRILRSALCGDLLTDTEREHFRCELYRSENFSMNTAVKIANKHHVMHLFAYGLKINNLLDENTAYLTGEITKAIFRFEKQDTILDEICRTFENAKIPFIPLKGCVICNHYPEPWMRTNCDIDILIHKNDIQNATNALADHGYKRRSQGSHDVTVCSPTGTHIELHYTLIENLVSQSAADVLNDVWDKVRLKKGSDFQYEMSDEMFYFYHMAHMAKHIEHGGCGIRPLADLWILNHCTTFDADLRQNICALGGLSTFAEQTNLLSEIWFGEAQHTSLTKQLEQYIIHGGSYGTNQNRITVQQQKHGGKFGYAISKIFIPYDEIKFHYAILEKHKWLTPIMEVRRWGKLIFCGHAKRTLKELNFNRKISDTTAKSTDKFLRDIGLK